MVHTNVESVIQAPQTGDMGNVIIMQALIAMLYTPFWQLFEVLVLSWPETVIKL